MAKFLNTSGINYFLEELIKNAYERLILISPFLKFNSKIKELIEDKNRLKIDIRIIYGKNELHPDEMSWLKSLNYVRTSFCQNLHAKCYINEKQAIISSMNLYDFSQINNNEMGVLINKDIDTELYQETYEETQRLIRISDEVKVSIESTEMNNNSDEQTEETNKYNKLTTAKLAKSMGISTPIAIDRLKKLGYLREDDKQRLWITEEGKKIGGEFKMSQKYGYYFLWPIGLKL